MSNEYDAAVTASLQPDTAQAARVGFSVAADTNPDAYAEAQRVARRTGVPVDTVFAMPAEMKKQDAIGSIDFNDLAKTSPATAALLADVEKAKVAHDDVDNMSKIESALYSIGKFEAGTGKAIASSAMKFNEGAWGLARAGADLLPDVIGDPLANKFAEYGASQRDIAARLMPKTDNIVESSWYSGMQSLGLNLLQLPLGVGGKMTPLLTAMGLNTGGQAYGEARDKGRSVPESLVFGTSQGIVEAGTEMFGMPALLSMLKPGGFGKKALEYLVKEQGGEQVATHLQDLNEWATLNPDKTIGDYLAARPSAALQTALATAFGGGGQVAIMRGAQLIATRGKDALQANNMGDLLTGLNKLAEASKLRERDTESAQAFFQSVLDEGRDAVYVSPEALAQSGLAEKMAQAIPAVAEQLQTAAEAGHDIRIPIADLMATMAGPELEQSLLPHVATEPGGFTPTTAKEYLQSGAAQDLQTEVERVLGEKQVGDTFKQSADAVKATIKEQLTTAGRFTESVNDAYSSMVSNFYAVQAARMGITPDAMFERYPLRIGAESVAGQQFDQSGTLRSVDLSGNGNRVDHFDDKKGLMYSAQRFPTGIRWTVFETFPEEDGGNQVLGEMFKYKSLDEAQAAARGLRVSATQKAKNSAKYGAIPNLWKGEEKKVAKALVDAGVGIERFASSTQSRSKYIYLDSGLKVRLADHALPGNYDQPDIDYRYGGDVKNLVDEVRIAEEGAPTPNSAATQLPGALDQASMQERPKAEPTQFESGAGSNVNITDSYLQGNTARGSFNPATLQIALAEQGRSMMPLFTSPEAMFKRYPLRIGTESVAGGQQFDQSTGKVLHQPAYHGSPHKFSKFSLEHIGTGEGAHAFGWGLYFAGNREVAEWYRDKLSFRSGSLSHATFLRHKGDNVAAIKDLESQLGKADDENNPFSMFAESDDSIRSAIEEINNASLYEVDIPEDDTMLLWDKPLSEQPEKVRAALGAYQFPDAKMDGGEMYAFIRNQLADQAGGGSSKAYYKESRWAEAASKFLNSLGISGIKYLDGTSRTGSDGSFNYVIFDDSAVEVLNTYYQNEKAARGSFNPATLQITLLKNADLSTFLHESGHFFLEVMADMAAQPDAPAHVQQDMQAMFDWFGVKDLAEWSALDFEEKRSYHEQFARGFESYLFEGKAPSIEIQSLFQRFRAWMLNVYRDLKALNVELTDEVRGVFDRMLATNEQIALAEQGRSMMPLFTSPEQIGMTPAEFADYQALGTDATNEAIEDLQARGLRDMQWIHNARGRIIKKLQAQANEQRAAVEMDVRREVMAQPIYQAWQFLTGKAGQKTGTQIEHDQAIAEWKSERADYEQKTRDDLKAKLLDANPDTKGIKRGQLLAKNKRQMDIDTQQAMLEWDRANQKPEAPAAPAEGETAGGFEFGRLNISALSEIGLPAEVIQTLKAHRMTSKDGFHPDIVAEMFGFSSGDELARKLAAAESPKAEIEALTDQRMLEQFGDLSSQQAIEKAADKAIHNEARARMISTELAMLEKAVGKRTTLASAAKEYAAAMIARLKVRDIKPGQYASGEVRASKAAEKASKSGDIAQAAAEKRNQLINAYATRAAYDAQEEVERGRRYFGRFDKPGSIDQEYAEQIHALLERYDLRKSVSGNSIDRQASLRTWVQSQLNAGELPLIAESLLTPAERSAYVAQIESRGVDGELVYSDDEERIKLLADAIDRSEKRSYKMLTVEEFRGLVDTVKQIEHLGRLKHKLMTARDNADYEAVRDDIAAGIADEASATGKNTRTANDWLGQKLQAIRQFGAAHIKVATWARIMDGGKDNGPVWRYLIQPANERASQETTMRADATAKLDAILRPIMSKVSMADKMGKGKFFTGINDSLNWQERFAVLLNLGNESNTQRLMAGKGWTMAQIMPIINTFSDEELRAAQAVWDHFEEYRPLIASKELRVTGKEPEWIPARQITLNANDGQVVTLRGGYYPVVYDPRVNLKASQHSSAEEAKNLLKASYSAATTRRSFTKARVEEVHGRPILLNMQGLYSGVNDVIHDLAWHEWVMDANKLLRSKTIDTAIRNHYGPEVKREFEKWRDDIVAGNRRLDHAIEKAAGWARQSVSGSSLTFNIVSAAMQPLGIANSISRVGAHWIGKGIARYASGPLEATREAQEKSEWMANRTRTRFRELNELRNQVQGQTAVKELMGRYGYWMMMRAQMMVDVPTWWGAYEKGIADGHDETTAINLADQSVKDSQGGGEEVDQSGVERGGPLVKLFTAFYGFMGTTLNTAYLNGKTEKSKAKMAVNMLLVLSVPSVLGSLFKDALVPGDAGDDDSFLKKLLIEQLSFLFGLVAFGREFTPIIKAVSGESNGQSYSGPTGLRVIPDTINLGKQAGQGEFDDAFRKAFINVVGDLTGIPSVQINRTITGAKALVEGETSNPAAIAFGFQKPR